MRVKMHLLLVTLMLMIASVAGAQVTTSSVSGKIVADNENVIGATITAVHEPSGTKYNAVTNHQGRYAIQGMRSGGPYTITISYIGYNQEVFRNVNLALGQEEVINANLKEDARSLGEVVVNGQAGKGGNGAATNFSQQQIENTPTIDRNIYDVAKLSPLVTENKFGGITIAGTNNRYNSFQIDGMVSNDVFGLTSSGTNGGQTSANPISMDAIEQIQIAVSPFDVRQSGFTGGAINAITKSGTNTFKGTAFGYYTDENMYGRYSQLDRETRKLNEQSTQTYGFTFGGPIIKDKLFFFTSLEYKKNEYPASNWAGKDGYFMTEDYARQLSDIYYKYTGIRESYGRRDVDRESMGLLGRLDWNINDNNHLSFRYQGNISYADNYSAGTHSYTFNNSGYRIKDRTHSFVAEWTSRIGQKYYNELRAGYTRVRDHRAIPYGGPTLYFSGTNTVSLGTDYSSGVNSLDQDVYTLEDNFSIYSGNHTITLGTHNEYYYIKNGFYQAAFGEYSYNFSDLEEFLANPDLLPTSYQMKYSDEGLTGSSYWITPFKAGQFGLYIQDKWDVSHLFQLTYGLRLDVPFYFNRITYNDAFNRTEYWSKEHNAIIGRRPANSVLASPRVGFRWYFDDSHQSLLRGGVGIFNGRAPFVWLENEWANTGMEMKGLNIRNSRGNYAGPTFGQYGRATTDQIRDEFGAKGGVNPDIVTVDHKFKFPQVFRANLAWEQQLPGGIKMTLEALYSKNLNAVWFENLCLKENGTVYAVPGVEASGVPYYSSSQTDTYYDENGQRQTLRANSVINLSNISKGHSYSFSVKFDKSFDFGLDLMASYTFGHSYSVNDGTSSVASSNWKYYYSADPQSKDVTYSLYDRPHRVVAQIGYNSKRYGGRRWQTHAALTYNGQSGQRYSLIMSDNSSASYNGDYARGNTTLYIPTKTELQNMNMSDEDKASFETWIEGDDYAKDHRGRYAPRNSNMAPWENLFDFHFAQDFFYLKERGSKISIVFDIVNVGNLLNKKWGKVYSSAYAENILNVTSVSYDRNTKIATPSYRFLGYKPEVSDIYSRWHMQLGLRATF